MLVAILLVAAGGFCGGLGRWGLTKVLPERVAILTANVVGSFILGAGVGAPGLWPLALAVGVGGGMSTWSTFANQVGELVDKRHLGTATRYITLTVILSVIAAWRGGVWGARIAAGF